MNFHKFSSWVALTGLALMMAGSISRSAFAQTSEAGQQPAVSNQVVLVALTEPAPVAAKATGANMAAPPKGSSGSSDRWSGPYIGINFGYGKANADTFFNPLPDAATFINLAPQTLHPNPSGITGGAQIGYNHQNNHFVLGLEGDFSGSGINGTKTITPIIQNDGTAFPGAGFVRAHQDIPWFGTVRGRAGFAFSHVLVYGTFGVIYARVNNSANTDFQPVGTTIYLSAPNETKTGWTGGGGAEFAFSGRWSVKGEYLHYDLGNVQKTANPQILLPPFQVAYTWAVTGNLARFGLNYRF